MGRDFEAVADAEGRNRSELFRELFRVHRAYRKVGQFERLVFPGGVPEQAYSLAIEGRITMVTSPPWSAAARMRDRLTHGRRHEGTGTAVLDALCKTLAERGVRELWLVTTNDNVDAQRFYQRRGFVLAELRAGGVDEARRLKPSIPRVGSYDIPMSDEFVPVRSLDPLARREDA